MLASALLSASCLDAVRLETGNALCTMRVWVFCDPWHLRLRLQPPLVITPQSHSWRDRCKREGEDSVTQIRVAKGPHLRQRSFP